MAGWGMGRPEYLECAECATKIGAYTLCKSCLHNRTTIDRLVDADRAEGFRPALEKAEDAYGEWLGDTYPRAMDGFKQYAREAFIAGYLAGRIEGTKRSLG